jgi:AcrR family transcriptional regulator
MASGQPHRRPRADPQPSASQERERLVAAISKAASEHGYPNLTVELVARYADLTPATFHQHFDSLHRALLAAQETFFERLWAHVAEACDAQSEWIAQVKAALDAALEFLIDAAALSRVFAVEVAAAGPGATQRQLTLIERFAARLRDGRAHYPDAASLSPATEQAVIGGIASLISGHLLAEQPDLLPALAPDFLELLLTPYMGRAEAQRVAQA